MNPVYYPKWVVDTGNDHAGYIIKYKDDSHYQAYDLLPGESIPMGHRYYKSLEDALSDYWGPNARIIDEED